MHVSFEDDSRGYNRAWKIAGTLRVHRSGLGKQLVTAGDHSLHGMAPNAGLIFLDLVASIG